MADPARPTVPPPAVHRDDAPEVAPPAGRGRRRLVGPFSGRQLAAVGVALLLTAGVAALATLPLGRLDQGGPADPRPTAFLVGSPSVGLTPGSVAPELAGTRPDGTAWQLLDVTGQPVRLADHRGHGVWLNFWASWCPPCQAETPVLRQLDAEYRSRGLDLIGISVQESNVDDVRAYAERYGLGYTIAADLSADVFHAYRIFALPTQVFIDPQGIVRAVIQGPLGPAQGAARIAEILPVTAPSGAASPVPSARPSS
jgi:thiol-disulfide isomerase/thioredoxin